MIFNSINGHLCIYFLDMRHDVIPRRCDLNCLFSITRPKHITIQTFCLVSITLLRPCQYCTVLHSKQFWCNFTRVWLVRHTYLLTKLIYYKAVHGNFCWTENDYFHDMVFEKTRYIVSDTTNTMRNSPFFCFNKFLANVTQKMCLNLRQSAWAYCRGGASLTVGIFLLKRLFWLF